MKITELLKALEEHKTRSAWDNGVKGYAIEMLERLLENGTTDFHGSPADRKELLNGADDWSEASWGAKSHVVRMIREAMQIASALKPSILLFDRYFLTIPALMAWINEEKQGGKSNLHIITKAKSNVVAYEKPSRKKGRGRPPKKGKSIKLNTMFASRKNDFTKTGVKIYGKNETVSFLCLDLLWGRKLYLLQNCLPLSIAILKKICQMGYFKSYSLQTKTWIAILFRLDTSMAIQ